MIGFHRKLGIAIFGSSLCAVLGSCNVGPDYHRPEINMLAAYKSPTTRSATVSDISAEWWRFFGDEELDKLEEAALSTSPDLQAAMARVVQARAAARIVGSQFYPVINANPSATWSRANPTTGGPAVGATGFPHQLKNVTIPLDLSYEIDVWGRVRRSYEAANAQVQASADDYGVVLLTLVADVAQDYFTLRFLDTQDELLSGTVESYRKQVELTQKQVKADLASRITEQQAAALLNSTISQQVDVRRQRADTEHALAILLGRAPSELTIAVRPLNVAPPAVPAGLPADLLRQRPDVAEAEQNLIAANAQIGVATAQLYPAFQLTGAAGFESPNFANAVDWQQRFWSLGPSASIPIFNGGKLTAAVAQAKARYDELTATFRGSVLGAIRDVEDSLTDLHMRADQAAAQDLAVNASREYLRLADLQYRSGLATYLQVVDAERTLLSNELLAVQIRSQRLISTVVLIKSLGGGWSPQGTVNAPDPLPVERPEK
ncbi:MAG: efflux transporter outer membrane subunit [Tepidisphaeraceae bacterium]|jgi:multidrug efflux system outer membrane protein